MKIRYYIKGVFSALFIVYMGFLIFPEGPSYFALLGALLFYWILALAGIYNLGRLFTIIDKDIENHSTVSAEIKEKILSSNQTLYPLIEMCVSGILSFVFIIFGYFYLPIAAMAVVAGCVSSKYAEEMVGKVLDLIKRNK